MEENTGTKVTSIHKVKSVNRRCKVYREESMTIREEWYPSNPVRRRGSDIFTNENTSDTGDEAAVVLYDPIVPGRPFLAAGASELD